MCEKQSFDMIFRNTKSAVLFRKIGKAVCTLAEWNTRDPIDPIYENYVCAFTNSPERICTDCDLVQAIDYGFNEMLRLMHRYHRRLNRAREKRKAAKCLPRKL